MSLVVLIHGSAQNPSCWDLVRAHLERAGHEAIAVELPADRPDLTASELARIAVAQIPASGADCVVVGHSASGVLLPFVARLRPVAAIVYLAAMIPEEGLSALDQFERNPSILDAAWVEAGPRWRDPANWRELADHFLFHDVQLTRRDWAYSTLRPMRIDGALREVSPGPRPPRVRALNAVCDLDRTINPRWQERVWGESRYTRIRAGHCPQVSTPAETAAAISYAADEGRWTGLRHAGVAGRRVPPQFDPLGEPIGYDELMDLEGRARFEVLIRMTPENKSEVMKEHLKRWKEAHRDRLTPEQVALLDEHLEFIRPELYQPPHREDDLRRRSELIERSMLLFSREEIAEALSIRGRRAG